MQSPQDREIRQLPLSVSPHTPPGTNLTVITVQGTKGPTVKDDINWEITLVLLVAGT